MWITLIACQQSGIARLKNASKWEIPLYFGQNKTIYNRICCNVTKCAFIAIDYSSPLFSATYSTKHIELTELSTLLGDK